MGGGMHGGFGNTAGSNKTIAMEINNTPTLVQTPKAPSYKYSIPRDKSKQAHIFSDREGHLNNTPENHKLVRDVANDKSNYKGKDSYGNHWYSKIQSDGSQVWVSTHAGKISNAGKNKKPRIWDDETGYNNNPKKNTTWRKGKGKGK